MTLKELKENHDRYYAFSHFMTVEEAKRLGSIPEEYWDYFQFTGDQGNRQ